MKIAIPTSDGKLDPHFGHCQLFTFIEVDEEAKTITGAETLPPPPHEPGVLPVWLAEQGANIIISGGMGGRAIALLEERNIRVILGAPLDTPEALAKTYLDGTLQEGKNACDH
ncbi:MAG: NifB/NifX family molybdenum-iron cluster-binding protein [Bdellovibrionales bacterium]